MAERDAEPGGLPVSAPHNKVSQHLAPLGSQGQDATGGLYLPCSGWPHYSTPAHLPGLVGRRWLKCSKDEPRHGPEMYPIKQHMLLECPPWCPVCSCAVMVRIIFLGLSRFRKQFVHGSNPTWRHWIMRQIHAWLKKSLLEDCNIATCLPCWHRLPQPSLLPSVRERIWAKVVIFPDEMTREASWPRCCCS